jgi:hypothetical protein
VGYQTVILSNLNGNGTVYTQGGETRIRAQMMLKNEGNVSISYGAWGITPYGWKTVQTDQGATNGDLAPPFTGGTIVLFPGSNRTFSVLLPTNTTRWQCGLSVYTASLRDRAVWKLFPTFLGKWFPQPCIWAIQALPYEMGPKAEVKSKSIEVGRGFGNLPRNTQTNEKNPERKEGESAGH